MANEANIVFAAAMAVATSGFAAWPNFFLRVLTGGRKGVEDANQSVLKLTRILAVVTSFCWIYYLVAPT
jgi:hypothetical protein